MPCKNKCISAFQFFVGYIQLFSSVDSCYVSSNAVTAVDLITLIVWLMHLHKQVRQQGMNPPYGGCTLRGGGGYCPLTYIFSKIFSPSKICLADSMPLSWTFCKLFIFKVYNSVKIFKNATYLDGTIPQTTFLKAFFRSNIRLADCIMPLSSTVKKL